MRFIAVIHLFVFCIGLLFVRGALAQSESEIAAGIHSQIKSAEFEAQKNLCRILSGSAALSACQKARGYNPSDPYVNNRIRQLSPRPATPAAANPPAASTPRPPVQRPQPQQPPVQRPQPGPSPFDNYWKQCRMADTQAALNACKQALRLRSGNSSVKNRITSLEKLLQPPPALRPVVRPSQQQQSPVVDPFDAHWMKCQATSTRTALNACQQALKLRPNNAIVRSRTNQLTQLLTPQPQRPATPVVVERSPERVVPPVSQQVNNKPEPDEKSAINEQRIIEIQKMLTQMGFDTGGIDGQVGKQTRKALSDFRNRAGVKLSAEFTEQDLIKLQAAQDKHDNAKKVYQQAVKDESNDDLTAALAKLDEAINLAPWYSAPVTLKQDIEQQMTSEVAQKNEEADKLLEELEDSYQEFLSLTNDESGENKAGSSSNSD